MHKASIINSISIVVIVLTSFIVNMWMGNKISDLSKSVKILGVAQVLNKDQYLIDGDNMHGAIIKAMNNGTKLKELKEGKGILTEEQRIRLRLYIDQSK